LAWGARHAIEHGPLLFPAVIFHFVFVITMLDRGLALALVSARLVMGSISGHGVIVASGSFMFGMR
jgi:hypothetical protein